ncbi:MAG TPA: hypothetical protein VEY92_10385 [Pseudoxanthomonas sp.]|nr:hypothetical protein [Pseudoxanthomonas sp.]
MKDQMITTLASIGVLLLAGIATGTASGGAPAQAPMAGLIDSIERKAPDASAKADALKPEPKRRARPSLSMPYFSFARSLRPRG